MLIYELGWVMGLWGLMVFVFVMFFVFISLCVVNLKRRELRDKSFKKQIRGEIFLKKEINKFYIMRHIVFDGMDVYRYEDSEIYLFQALVPYVKKPSLAWVVCDKSFYFDRGFAIIDDERLRKNAINLYGNDFNLSSPELDFPFKNRCVRKMFEQIGLSSIWVEGNVNGLVVLFWGFQPAEDDLRGVCEFFSSKIKCKKK